MLFRGDHYLHWQLLSPAWSRDVIQVLEKLVTAHGLTDKVELKGSFCMGECTKGGVCVRVNEQKFSLTPADVPSFFKNEILEKLA